MTAEVTYRCVNDGLRWLNEFPALTVYEQMRPFSSLYCPFSLSFSPSKTDEMLLKEVLVFYRKSFLSDYLDLFYVTGKCDSTCWLPQTNYRFIDLVCWIDTMTEGGINQITDTLMVMVCLLYVSLVTNFRYVICSKRSAWLINWIQ